MRVIQFREAICEAMSEEMRLDETIYLMGEEVAEYNGAYKASKGMLDEFGEKRVIDTPISELGFSGIGVGACCIGIGAGGVVGGAGVGGAGGADLPPPNNPGTHIVILLLSFLLVI